MARFKIAAFIEGNVWCSHWVYPKPGRKVGLSHEGGDLIIHLDPWAGEVIYTWPRDPHPNDDSRPFTVHDQVRLAIRHYERRTGRDAFTGKSVVKEMRRA